MRVTAARFDLDGKAVNVRYFVAARREDGIEWLQQLMCRFPARIERDARGAITRARLTCSDGAVLLNVS